MSPTTIWASGSEAARRSPQIVNRCDAAAGEYLAQPGVSLETPRESVARAFLLDEVFRDLLDEAETDTLTVNSCMSTIVPISETTACLPLGLLNDDGYLDAPTVRSWWDAYLGGDNRWHYPLWAVLMFQGWRDQWLR